MDLIYIDSFQFMLIPSVINQAPVAQSVERGTFNPRVSGSSPPIVGIFLAICHDKFNFHTFSS